jgi:hypothetical protein
MFHLFAVVAALSAPTLDASCVSWTQATEVSVAQTKTCMTHFLTHAYNGAPTKEAMSLDPIYGQAWEVKIKTAQLKQARDHITAACKGEHEVETVCFRSAEFFDGLIGRRMSLSEGVLGNFSTALGKVLRGEKLVLADLKPGELQWSRLTLWRLRNAAYARHGYLFKNPDLNAFFYDARKDQGVLPVPRGMTKAVKLTAIDGANVRLIKSME